jgi:putative ABC transport system substrate-binding protein
MRRREFIAALGGAAVWPLAARGQSPRRIGFLDYSSANDPEGNARIAAFRSALVEAGWPGLQIDVRRGLPTMDQMRSGAADLVRLSPEVIFVVGTEVLEVAKEAAPTTPIVFVAVSDPVKGGFVASLAHPGGNITGFASYEGSIAGKWLELLHEAAPDLKHVLILGVAAHPLWPAYVGAAETAAAAFGIQIGQGPVLDAGDVNRVLEAAGREGNTGLMVPPSLVTAGAKQLIVQLAAERQMPAIYCYKFFVEAGGMMSYSLDAIDVTRRGAAYVDRILRGEKPADLPVQLPAKFELVINLKAAKALGIEIPAGLVARADEVKE